MDITVSGSTLTFSLPSNMRLVDYHTRSKTTYGEGHIHLWVDTNKYTTESAIKVFTNPYTLEGLKPGPHTIHAELVTNTHTSLIPKTTSELSFTYAAPTPTPSLAPFSLPVFQITTLALLLVIFSLYFVSLHTKNPKSKNKKFKK